MKIIYFSVTSMISEDMKQGSFTSLTTDIGLSSCTQSYNNVLFYDKLDFISLSAYFRLRKTRKGPYPDLEETKRLYQLQLNQLLAWRRNKKLEHKKIYIAEFGIQSKGKIYFVFLPCFCKWACSDANMP